MLTIHEHPEDRRAPLSYQIHSWWCRSWEKVDPERNQARYYELSLQQDLWGNWELRRAWGRVGQCPSRVVLEGVPTPEAAEDLAEQVHRRRLQHGYQRVW